jgi:C-terminal processing protease CtpA/Prc
MVNEFLPQGALIVYTEGHSQPKKTYNADAKGKFRDKEIVVLIDDFSASASEIFSAPFRITTAAGWLVAARSGKAWFRTNSVQRRKRLTPDCSPLLHAERPLHPEIV